MSAGPAPVLLHDAVPAPRAARPLRVVYVWDADYPWDVRTEKVCRALADAGHNVHIVARNRAWRAPEEPLPEGTVHRLRPWRALGRRLDEALGFPVFFSPRWLRHVDGVVRRVSADVVIVRDLPLAPTALAAARRRGAVAVLDMAENYPAMIRAIFETGRQRAIDYVVRNPAAVAAVERWAIRRFDRILVVVQESAARLHALGIPPERIAIVSNTPPLSELERALPRAVVDGGAMHVVYLGQLEVLRGVGELVEAAALLRDAGAPARVTIIGKGRDRALFERRAAELGLAPPMLEFTGFLPRAEALARLAAADVGVIPHHANDLCNSTVPNKLFDYMALGLPVVTSSTAPCARVVRESGAGEVFESGCARSLAAAIGRLARADRRLACGRAGREAVRQRYHWEADAAELLATIEGAAAVKRERPR